MLNERRKKLAQGGRRGCCGHRPVVKCMWTGGNGGWFTYNCNYIQWFAYRWFTSKTHNGGEMVLCANVVGWRGGYRTCSTRLGFYSNKSLLKKTFTSKWFGQMVWTTGSDPLEGPWMETWPSPAPGGHWGPRCCWGGPGRRVSLGAEWRGVGAGYILNFNLKYLRRAARCLVGCKGATLTVVVSNSILSIIAPNYKDARRSGRSGWRVQGSLKGKNSGK